MNNYRNEVYHLMLTDLPKPTVLSPSRFLNSVFIIFSMLFIKKNSVNSMILCTIFYLSDFLTSTSYIDHNFIYS